MKSAAHNGPVVAVWQEVQPVVEDRTMLPKLVQTILDAAVWPRPLCFYIYILGVCYLRHYLFPSALAEVCIYNVLLVLLL